MTVNFENLVYEQIDRVVIITLNQPNKRNALSSVLTKELIAAIKHADAEDQVGAILLTGSGKAFCAGGDLGDFAQMGTKTAPDIHQEGVESTELFRLGGLVTKPIIAAVNGAAMGGGCGLAAMCHIVIASEKAKFGVPEIKVGMFPFVIFPLLAKSFGARKALELALTGGVVDAKEAQRLGLVSQVVEADSLIDQAQQLAQTIAGYSSMVLRLGLDAYNNSLDMEINQAFRYLNTLRVVDFMSEDLKEGARAFLEKRDPRWMGR